MVWMKADLNAIEQAMRQHNNEHHITCKSIDPEPVRARIIFKATLFDEGTPEQQRIYEFTSDNKAYIAGQSSASIFLVRAYPIGDHSLFSTDVIKTYDLNPDDLEWAGIEIR